MRREFRKKQQGKPKDKILMYSISGVLILLTIVFGLLMYYGSLNEDSKKSQLNPDQIASMVNNETDVQSASSNIGKTVEEREKQEEKANLTIKQENKVKDSNTNSSQATIPSTSTSTQNTQSSGKNTTDLNKTKKENIKELSFQKPLVLQLQL